MKYLIVSAIALTFMACGEKTSTSETTKTETTQTTTTTTPAAAETASNGIVLKENGLKVSKAVLLHADGSAISDDNTVGIGDDVLCRLFISGWKEENGRVKLGAAQTIETGDGDIVLEQEDLFETLESASIEDAGVITVKATITELKKSIRDFVVNFRIWDKSTQAEVSGSYNFHLK